MKLNSLQVSLLGSCAVCFGGVVPTFRKNLLSHHWGTRVRIMGKIVQMQVRVDFD
jgi:hypothetical protein